MSKKSEIADNATLSEPLNELYASSLEKKAGLRQGLENLTTLPENPLPLKGKEFADGVMGFRKQSFGLQIAIACGKAMVRYLDLKKYIALVENLHDPRSATIMLQNFSDSTEGARGQVLGRINADCSAITIIQGVTGRVIRGPSDIALYDTYFLSRADMTSFYLATKAQISNADQLESMIASFDGWKAFEIPLNPLDPYGIKDGSLFEDGDGE